MRVKTLIPVLAISGALLFTACTGTTAGPSTNNTEGGTAAPTTETGAGNGGTAGGGTAVATDTIGTPAPSDGTAGGVGADVTVTPSAGSDTQSTPGSTDGASGSTGNGGSTGGSGGSTGSGSTGSQPGIPATGSDFSGMDAEQIGQAALNFLGTEGNVTVPGLAVVSAMDVDWPDSCLGLGGANESCAAVVTPGWLVTLRAGDQTFKVRANEDGTQFRIDNGAAGSSTSQQVGGDSTTAQGNTASSGLDTAEGSGEFQGGFAAGQSVPVTGASDVGPQIFLVQENGSGAVFGSCGDALVGVPADVDASGEMADTLRQLYSGLFDLDMQNFSSQGLSSVFEDDEIRLESVTVYENGQAVIRLFGEMVLTDPSCDPDRVRYQLEQLGNQFDEITDVEIYVNDAPLGDVLSGSSTTMDY